MKAMYFLVALFFRGVLKEMAVKIHIGLLIVNCYVERR